MTETLFQSLLRELFEGSGDELRSCLQPLTAAQRKALFGEFGPLPNILQRTCRYHSDARPVRLIHLYQAIRDDPSGFLRDQATLLALPGALNNPQTLPYSSYETLRGFYSRLQLLQTGLADVYELDNAKDAANMRAMVANMAAIRFGPNRVGTKVIENTLYVWLKEPEAEAGE